MIPKRERLIKRWFKLLENITPVFSGIPSKAEIEEYRIWFRTIRKPERYNYPASPLYNLTQWSEDWLSFMIEMEREHQREREDFIKWRDARRKTKSRPQLPSWKLPKMKHLQRFQATNQKSKTTGNSFDPVRKSATSATKLPGQHSRKGKRLGEHTSL